MMAEATAQVKTYLDQLPPRSKKALTAVDAFSYRVPPFRQP
jgi:hypothetical protein